MAKNKNPEDAMIKSKIDQVMEKSKKSGRIDPSETAKDLLKTVSTIDQTLEFEKIVDNILRRNEMTISKQSSWPDVISYLEKNERAKNEKTTEFVDKLLEDNFSSAVSARRARYNEYRSAVKKIPVLNKILRVYTANVLSPDDITKISLRCISVDNVLESDDSVKTMIGKYTIICNKINLEKYVKDIVYKTFLLGDYFLEIQSSKRSLVQTLYNLQLPVTENNSSIIRNLNKSASVPKIVDKYKIDTKFYNNKNIDMTIMESEPLFKQITHTTEDLQNVINEIFMGGDLSSIKLKNGSEFLSESYIEEKLEDPYTYNVLRSICEESGIELDKLKKPYETYEFSPRDKNKNFDNNRNDISKKKEKDDDEEDKSYMKNLKHVIDVLPIEASLSNIILNPIDPENIIVLEKDNVCYGYLYIKGMYDSGNASKAYMTYSATSGTGTTGSTSALLSGITSGLNTEKVANNEIVKGFVDKLSDYIKEKFAFTNDDGTSKINIDEMAPGLQMLVSNILNSASGYDNVHMNVRYIPPSNIQHFKYVGMGTYLPYGESLLDDLMFTAKMVLADNVSSTINKISKVGRRMVCHVRSNTYQQSINNIEKVRNSIQKQSVTMDDLGSIDMIPASIGTQKCIYIPRINGEDQMEIDSLDMGAFADYNDPNETMLKQLISGSDIPPTALGHDEYSNSKANLTSENVIMAQNIISSQKEFGDLFTELVQKIYMALYAKTKMFDTAYRYVKLAFNPPRTIMLNMLAENMGYFIQIADALKSLDVPNDKIVARFFPELVNFDFKIDSTIDKLANTDPGAAADNGGGYAPFDAGDLGGGGMPPEGMPPEGMPPEMMQQMQQMQGGAPMQGPPPQM